MMIVDKLDHFRKVPPTGLIFETGLIGGICRQISPNITLQGKQDDEMKSGG